MTKLLIRDVFRLQAVSWTLQVLEKHVYNTQFADTVMSPQTQRATSRWGCGPNKAQLASRKLLIINLNLFVYFIFVNLSCIHDNDTRKFTNRIHNYSPKCNEL